MKILALTALVLLSISAFTQRTGSNWPHPPAAADPSVNEQPVAPATPHFRTDPVQLQREAKELLELSESLQPDMDSVVHGLLPKDTLDKLKRIEKLSKHLRGELNHR